MKMKNLFSTLMAALVMMAVVFLGFGDSHAKHKIESPPGIHQMLSQKAVSPITFTLFADNAPIVQPILMAERGVGYLIESEVLADLALLRSDNPSKYNYKYIALNKRERMKLYKSEHRSPVRFVPRLT